jgi:hypothetical protein
MTFFQLKYVETRPCLNESEVHHHEVQGTDPLLRTADAFFHILLGGEW